MSEEDGIELETIQCFLVIPAKGLDPQPKIGATQVPKHGQLFKMLKGIFQKAETECQTDISFNHNSKGIQQNDCRDLLLAHVKEGSISTGRKAALRLQMVTTQKSGLGLLFLMVGKKGGIHKLVLSRFPANNGILAEQDEHSLSVSFLEKVFMKSATAYKSAVYKGTIAANDFWKGRAIDKQVTNSKEDLANYWIRDFLASEFLTTPAAGTRRLGQALKDALKLTTALETKNQIVAAATLAKSIAGKTTSISDFCAKFGLSSDAREAVRKVVKHEILMTEHFQFDATEFSKHVAFRSVELSNGGTLTADAEKFDEVFKKQSLKGTDDQVRFSTQGKIVEQKLRKVRV